MKNLFKQMCLIFLSFWVFLLFVFGLYVLNLQALKKLKILEYAWKFLLPSLVITY